MLRLGLTVSAVLAVMFVVPLPFYGLASAVADLEPPDGASPLHFMLEVLLTKLGFAITFVLVFRIARESLSRRWLQYALLWWVAFALTEIGQAIGPSYSLTAAAAGIASESVYFPLSAYITYRLIGTSGPG